MTSNEFTESIALLAHEFETADFIVGSHRRDSVDYITSRKA